ncbi:hypothetical protein UFOVP104_41 [uncultured Caudovirales phage]|uniref:Uncharacterized protein n=1 Tax=uncultured Caudovirales phage TaxID=2100421 RepID=A0A6J5L5A5_9CAUD|nr:hypothetical protein UFOVP104_41 [uncultured Caudovirales phage]CAB4134136.1 hypothetical protein UFOVP271_21 [uncultured Caudovirales phage]
MIVNKCKNCNKEFEASTKIKYCSKNCAYGILFSKGKLLTMDEIDNNRIKAYKPIV